MAPLFPLQRAPHPSEEAPFHPVGLSGAVRRTPGPSADTLGVSLAVSKLRDLVGLLVWGPSVPKM